MAGNSRSGNVHLTRRAMLGALINPPHEPRNPEQSIRQAKSTGNHGA